MVLKFNGVIRIEDDFLCGDHRVIGLHPNRDQVSLFKLNDNDGKAAKESQQSKCPTQVVVRSYLLGLISSGKLTCVEELEQTFMRQEVARLSGKAKAKYERRLQIASHFSDPIEIAKVLQDHGGISPLIKRAIRDTGCGKSTAYKVWNLYCKYGFSKLSLIPRYNQCGGPGTVKRWVDGNPIVGRKTLREKFGEGAVVTRVGITDVNAKRLLAAIRRKVKEQHMSAKQAYKESITEVYGKTDKENSNKPDKQAAEKGTYPSYQQVRRIHVQSIPRLQRIRDRVGDNYFDRNFRGLIGFSQEQCSGPGQLYAIDATMGDVHLVSNTDARNLIGRPIVYIIVDVWSTAIVGFYVCLEGPKWDTAKEAIYSLAIGPRQFAKLWGFDPSAKFLDPMPTLPWAMLCDRGEYLSAAANASSSALAMQLILNPSYRPDLKGIVEVLHRVAKDFQLSRIPAAFDRRREELRNNPKAAQLTLGAYVKYLYSFFQKYNFTSLRRERMTTHMIADGVSATPAGLWTYGHKQQIGFTRAHSPIELMTHLLPSQKASITQNGFSLIN